MRQLTPERSQFPAPTPDVEARFALTSAVDHALVNNTLFMNQRIHDRCSSPSMFDPQRAQKPKNSGLFIYIDGVRQVMKDGRLQAVTKPEPKIEPHQYPDVKAKVLAAKARAKPTHALREEYLRLVEAS